MSTRIIDARYVIGRKLGAGSIGSVYQAHLVGDKIPVALKVLGFGSADLEGAQSLRDEFSLLSQLDHPYIVKILNFGLTSKKKPYFVMEYVKGPPFDQSLFQKITEVDFYSILADICLALDYLHAYGLIHQDVKPSNILLQSRPQGPPIAKLVDFGLATTKVAAGGVQLSGTLEYFAPEMIRGGAVDHRADLYSLGVTLYEVLTGENPFRAKDAHGILRNHLELIPKSPRMYNKKIPGALERIVLKLLEKDPLDRFPTASAVLDSLRRDAGYALTGDQERATGILPPSQFVGRESQIARLRRWHQEVMAGEARLVFIEGEFGIGKSRLLKEFAISCQLQGTAVFGHNWGCGGIPQLSSLAIEMPVFHVPGEVPGEGYRAWELICRQISQFSRAPLLLIEDLESSDLALLPFLDYLLDRLSGHPIMICASYQASRLDEERRSSLLSFQKRGAGSPVRTLKLRPLTKPAVAQLIRSRFKLLDGEEKLKDYLYQQSRGNPLYVEEFIAAIRAHKILVPCAGDWSLDRDRLLQLRFPRTLDDINQVAIAGMSQGVRELLSATAVIGDGFRLEDLRQVLVLPGSNFYAYLRDALMDGFLTREPAAGGRENLYYFAKTGLRESLYESIAPDVRKKLHRNIALRLERRSSGNRDLVAMADHFHRAGEYAKSSVYSPKAAERARAVSNPEEVYRLFMQALKAKEIVGDKSQLSSILEALGDSCSLSGRYAEGLQHYNRVLSQLVEPGSVAVMELQRKRAVLFRKQSQFEKALTILDEALAQAHGPGLNLSRARILAEIGWINRMKSDYEGALTALMKSLKLLRWGQDRADTAQVLNRLGVVSWTLGRYQEAQCYYERALKIYQELGDQERIAVLLDNLGLVYLNQGQGERAIEKFQECHHLRRTTADVFGEAKVCHNLAWAYAESGEWDQATTFYLQSQRIKMRLGDLEGLALTLNNLGILHMHRGMWSEAERCQEEALRIRKQLDNKYGLGASYDNFGDLARAKGEWKAAFGHYKRAQRLRTEIKDEVGACISLFNLGCLDVDQGHHQKAERSLLASRDCLERFENPVDLVQVDLALAELYLAMDRLDKAREFGSRSLSGASQAGVALLRAEAARTMATIEALSGNEAGSDELFVQSIEILKKLPARYELAKTYFMRGTTKQKGLRVRESIRYFRESLMIFQKLGVKHFMSRIEKRLESLQAVLDRQESAELFTLYTMSEILNSMHDLDLLLERVLDLAIDMLHAERGAIIFYDWEQDDFQVKIARSMEKQTLSDALEISRSTVKNVAMLGKPIVVDNALQDDQFNRWQSVSMYNIMSILCVPLKIKGKIIGTIYLDNRSVPGIFSARDISFLESFSNLTAMAIENAKLYSQLYGENVYLKKELNTKYKHDNFVGNSKTMQDIFNVIEKVSPSRASVLVLGESGTGKELVARLIHYSSPRKDRPFLKVNCAALTESLLETELFGIEEKIATGVKSRKGKFELADGGTIFLDEICDMSLSTQAKVLRVLQEREFERVGGSSTIKVDVRIISATNQEPQRAITERKFRKDLFYRLNTVTINIPPLRDRKEDIPFLIDYFMNKYCLENERERIIISAEAMEAFMKYDWPGNVRELENFVQRGVVMADGKLFPIEYVPSIVIGEGQEMTVSVPSGYSKLEDLLAFIERTTIEKSLREHGFVQVKAAKSLGIRESVLRYKMHKYNMKSSK